MSATPAHHATRLLPPLLRAMHDAAHGGDRRPLASLLLAHRAQLGTLAQALVDERLAVHAYTTITTLGLGGLWPRDALTLLHDQFTQQQHRSAQLLDAAAAVTAALRTNGIEHLVLKGLPVAHRWYGGSGARFTWDLDVLVREADVPRALHTLHHLGFAPPTGTRRLTRVVRRVAHALECRRADGLSLDLHWAFRRLPGVQFDAERVFAGRQMVEVSGQALPVPADEDTLTQVLLGIAADVDRSRCRLRALWDAYVILRERPAASWAPYLAARRADGSAGLVAAALSLVVSLLDPADASAVMPALRTAPVPPRARLHADHAAAIWSRPPNALRGHLDFAAWQPLPTWRYWPWWAATLPWRMYFARRL
jgi:hypothetical protein